MAQKGIREYFAKKMLAECIEKYSNHTLSYHGKVALIDANTKADDLASKNAWLKTDALVVKPDQLFGKRGKNGLIYLGSSGKGATWAEAKAWIAEHMNKEVKLLSGIKGQLTHFLIEPFMPHEEEYYISFVGVADGDIINFSTAGGVNVEENHNTMVAKHVPINEDISKATLDSLTALVPADKREGLAATVCTLLKFYREYHFGMLEFNPFSLSKNTFNAIDTVARLDKTAEFVCSDMWGDVDFPASFGQTETPEEAYIASLDEKTGASLKLTVLNPQGKVWTMVAGGGASVIYADTVVDLGFGKELANYGEYSGDPSTEDTREYAKTILDLMTRHNGKVLIIGGGIANFTDVAKTFDGIIQALEVYAPKLREKGIRIFVRRGGPNYKLGLSKIQEAAKKLGLYMEVYGPEEHMTRIVRRAVENVG